VLLLAEVGATPTEGLIERRELLPGVYLAGSLVKVVNGCVITSVLNTTEEEVDIPEPVVRVTKVDTVDQDPEDPMGQNWDRYERVLSKL
jgi:hypothetical protein